jgi:hypothetical protein
MEWWKDGILGMKSGWYLVFTSDACRMYINRPHSAKPSIPVFQHSNIPGHSIMAKPVISDLAQRTRFSMIEYILMIRAFAVFVIKLSNFSQ